MSDGISYLLSQSNLAFKIQRPTRTLVDMDDRTADPPKSQMAENGCPIVSDSSDEELRRLFQKPQCKSLFGKKVPLETMVTDEPSIQPSRSQFWSYPGSNKY
eukprot:TRINITY_DN1358_c0_g3_i4.p1 TRINITY_DN1358_c0_g3~~TRINITY_DN1358_c0_g3_i4.p1  ORF type:complete len:102 (+),score=11.73 TRINITY_DN1358_c0_g3_i4:78-383(+)